MFIAIQCLFLVLLLAVGKAQETEDILDRSTMRPVVVNLPEYGRIQGRRQSSIDFFGGLPYAAPPGTCGIHSCEFFLREKHFLMALAPFMSCSS